jgi:hypothetical protein
MFTFCDDDDAWCSAQGTRQRTPLMPSLDEDGKVLHGFYGPFKQLISKRSNGTVLLRKMRKINVI